MNQIELIKFQLERIKKNRQDLENMLEVELAELARQAANLERIKEKVAKIKGSLDYSELVLVGLQNDLDKIKAMT